MFRSKPSVVKSILTTHCLWSEDLKDFKKLENSLSTENGCLFYGIRVIIPSTLRNHILKLLHLVHFGMQRMKQLARSTVYWPRIDFDIEDLCHKCTSCGQFQNKPAKPSIHPWMMPEKPWSRLHLDHAINFLGRNWLVLVDAYSKYPCIHPTTSTSSNSTTAILEQEFAHFGYPHTLVTDIATTFHVSKSSKLGANNEVLYISPEHLIIQQQTVLPSV